MLEESISGSESASEQSSEDLEDYGDVDVDLQEDAATAAAREISGLADGATEAKANVQIRGDFE
jgi:hypothetical protein